MRRNPCYVSSQNLSTISSSSLQCKSASTSTYAIGPKDWPSGSSNQSFQIGNTPSSCTSYGQSQSRLGQPSQSYGNSPSTYTSYGQSQSRSGLRSQSQSPVSTQSCDQSQSYSQPQMFCKSQSQSCLPRCCCSDECSGLNDPYRQPCSGNTGPCSDNPNCHILKDGPCTKSKFTDVFPSPFRLPTVTKPAWLANCGKVLKFFGFYQESIPESGNENYRIHQCDIRFYLDDASIEVYEPKTFDPGFTQGKLIRRTRIPLPAPANQRFYELDDINVGCEVTLYGKTFLVTGCDDLTRKHLNKLGRAVPHNMEMPDDPYTVWRQDRANSLFARKAQINLDQDKYKKFLQNNAKVLRFWAYWDVRGEEGNLRRFVVHFFLEDDTVEIKEITDPDGGIRGALTFLGRSKLLKDFKDLVSIAGVKEEALLILNTAGMDRKFMDTSYLADRLCPGVDEKEFVTDKDLAIGAVLNVYGRPFIITDCDKATQIYYREKYGVEDFTPLVLTPEEVGKSPLKMEVPPHIGIGDEVDTLLNWDKLEPRQPKRDELALITKEKDVLGFEAKFDKTLNKVNGDRRFIMKIYMVDNTMQIFEKAHPNTGMKQGTFLSRSKVRRNGEGMTPRFELGENSEYFDWSEYFVGNILNCNGFRFLLTSADEFTFKYMEANQHHFPQSNLCRILDKVREAVGCLHGQDLLNIFSEKDTKLYGIIDAKDFRFILIHLTKSSLSEHELTTVTRAFRADVSEPPPDMCTLQAVIQTELQRYSFDKHLLERVEYTMRYHDPCKTGLLDRETVRSTLKGARLPIQKQLIDFLVDNFDRADDCNRINYCCLMKFIDWVDNTVPKANPTSVNCVWKFLEPKRPSKIFCINYKAFLDEICPNLQCALARFCCPEVEQQQMQQNQCQPQCPPIMLCMNGQQPQPDERCLAGQVISDNQVLPERFRCLEEDQRAQGCGIDYDPRPNVQWTSDDLGIDPCMMDAYRPLGDDEFNQAEAGNKEMYTPGDYIGWEDLYK